MTRDPILGAYGIRYQWKNSSREMRSLVLDEVSFEIYRGEVVALFGPNGSGKSTLMKVVAGVLPLNSRECQGQVRYLGKDFLSLPFHQRAQRVVYVSPDLKAEFPITAQEVVFLGRNCQTRGLNFRLMVKASQQDHDRVEWAMRKCLCWNLRARQLDSLSGGERQLVALARALAQGAQVMFLDEALSRMDLNHQEVIGKLLRELAAQAWAVVLVSHDMNLASEWADQAIFLKAGKKLFQGPIRDVLTQERIRALYPGANLTVGSNPTTGAPKVFFS